MDKGAHFHCCDFQVHTPRDLNWDGHRPQDEIERQAYAKDFVAACRAKGLDAVAITDHHDFGYFPYIKEAAKNETDSEGNPLPPEEQLVVFPGMELTLGIPCQALLILDAEFPVNLLDGIYKVLALNPNDHSEVTHAQIERLDNIRDFTELHNRLDEQNYLRGRYIILPNVSSGGKHTLQREGFLAHYKSMPCVGGYLDGPADQLGVGDKRILDGLVPAYNNKPLGVFPTSDNRQADFAVLGDHTTWVKWAEPTAEALRQACLARQTRISHTEPEVPSLIIEAIHVSNSKFMGPIDVEFNTQFNCLIGGRGTGKSTVLEYLRWALCDQPPAFAEGEEIPNFQAKRKSLIQNTLVPNSVDVHFNVNGVRHLVRRKADTHEVFLKVGNDDLTLVQEEAVRELLGIQAYSQKQLSAVGVRIEELVRFVEAPLKKRLGQLKTSVGDLKAEIRSSYEMIHRKRQLAKQIARDQLELESLKKQIEALKGKLKDLSSDDQAVLAQHEKYLSEEQLVETWGRELDQLQDAARTAKQSVSDLPTTIAEEETFENADLLKNMSSEVEEMFKNAKRLLDEIIELATVPGSSAGKLDELRRKWKGKFDAHEKQYEEVKDRASSQQKLLDQISEAEERSKQLKQEINKRKSGLSSLGNPEESYKTSRGKWVNTFRERADLLEERCSELTALSSGTLRASLKRGAGTTQVNQLIAESIGGTGIRGQTKKVDDLGEEISSAVKPVEMWETVLDELETLAMHSSSESSSETHPECPSLLSAGFTKGDIEKIASALSVERWIDLSLIELEDVPVFEYKQREGDYIRFDDASAGQQATALLRVLLNQKGPPLIIDQPEEDLDNEVILEIVQEIWKAKTNRQIIVTSHNANIVVNGDADLVVVCAYRTAGDQSGGRIKAQGAIDVEEIRKEITAVMEGGQQAFRLRKEKYGF